MNILAVDTSTFHGSVAVSEDGVLRGEVNAYSEVPYSRRLLRMSEFLLDQLRVRLRDIDAFSVVTGPGSFTGLRVGLGIVKGFALPQQKPIIGVPTLEVMAEKVKGEGDSICPLLDARRHEVYGALFQREESVLQLRVNESCCPPKVFLAKLPRNETLFFGDGALRYHSLILQALGEHARFSDQTFFLAATLATLAGRKAEAGVLPPPADVQANYIRGSDAQVHQGRRT